MSAAAWVCDSCETNNLAQASVCRVCLRAPGSVAGSVRSVPDQETPVRQQQNERPRFVDPNPKYGPTPPPAEVPRITITPPPARGSAPVPSGPRRGAGPAVIWLIIIGLLIVLIVAIIDNLGGSVGAAQRSEYGTGTDVGSGSAAAAQAPPRATLCPAAVATWLPDGGPGGALVAEYTTDRHVVTICRDESGQLYYDGQVRGAVASSQTHISLRADATANGFVAHNKGHVYEINGSQLTVTNETGEILRATLTRTG